MLDFKTRGWVSLAFGSSDAGTDVILCEIDESQSPPAIVLTDQFKKSNEPPALDIQLGGTSDVKLLGYSISDKGVKVKFSRKFDTGDKFDAVLKPWLKDVVFSWGDTPKAHFNVSGLFPRPKWQLN